MKTVFVLNPMAGGGSHRDDFVQKFNDAMSLFDMEAELYTTKSVGDAERFVRNYCKTFGGARFVACGGDGTLSEVLNGAIGFDGVSVGAIPLGTGNDFCRNFSETGFFDIVKQTTSPTTGCDSIICRLFSDGKERVVHCVNMINIGFDCNVVDAASRMKIRKFVPHSVVYLITALITLIRKKCSRLEISLDGRGVHEGELLLTTIANGSFCGGGFMSNPLASVSDGSIDVNIIKNVSRTKFLSLFPSYKKGNLMAKKGVETVAFTSKCKKMSVTSLSGSIKICLDGEVTEAERAEFTVAPSSFEFVVPH